MALTAHALTLVATLKADLGITGTALDSVLERVINAASAAIESYLGRHLEYSASVVEKIRGYGDFRLMVARTPLKTIGSIKLINQDGSTAATYDSTTYAIEHAERGYIYRSGGWIWTAQSGDDIRGSMLPGTEQASIQVTYSGGYVCPAQTGTRDLPEDIEEAALITAASLYRRRGADRKITNDSVGGAPISYEFHYDAGGSTGHILPKDVLGLLDRYRRAA